MLRKMPDRVRIHADRAIASGCQLAISSIALHELWYGSFKASRVEDAVWQLRIFLSGGIEVLAFDDEDARVSGQIRAQLAKAGTPIGAYDTLIGGQCLRRDLTLVTNNLSEFTRIEGLRCVDWTK